MFPNTNMMPLKYPYVTTAVSQGMEVTYNVIDITLAPGRAATNKKTKDICR